MTDELQAEAYFLGTTMSVGLGDPTKPQGTTGLRDLLSGVFIADAIVTLRSAIDISTGLGIAGLGTIQDDPEVENFQGLVTPLDVDYFPASRGVYLRLLPLDLLSEGQEVEFEIRAQTSIGVGGAYVTVFVPGRGTKKRSLNF